MIPPRAGPNRMNISVSIYGRWMVVDNLATDECGKGGVVKIDGRDRFIDEWCIVAVIPIRREVKNHGG